ncbi:MAG: VOC family protein [Chitinophagales bacterium]
MTSKENSLNWFELSVADMPRAKKFYETIFGIEMQTDNMMGMEMCSFPNEGVHGNSEEIIFPAPTG